MSPRALCPLALAAALFVALTACESAESVATDPLTGQICLDEVCVNPDGNQHHQCGCGADYCVPDERAVEFAGLTPLRCTQKDCVVGDPSTCPTDYTCIEIPAFALEWLLAERGIVMPATLCSPAMSSPPDAMELPVTDDETWIALPGGTFTMGPDADGGPRVQLEAFEMTKTAITTGQYRRCVAAGDCTAPGATVGCTGGDMATDLPINCVSWHHARTFCQSVGGELPTESQWEYAARNGGGNSAPWGDTPADCSKVVMQSDAGDGCGHGGPMPVCSRPSGNSAAGLCDLVGNLWEWTLDDYAAGYGHIATTGAAHIVADGTTKVSRGGAYSYGLEHQSAFFRNDHGQADFQVSTYGFRCVRAPAPPP